MTVSTVKEKAVDSTASKKKAVEIPEDAHPSYQPSATFPTYPKNFSQVTKLQQACMWTIQTGITVRIFGRHGIAKTAGIEFLGPQVAQMLGYPDAIVVKVPAATISPDDLISAAPVRENDGYVLYELLMEKLMPGKKFILLVDDSLQAAPIVQNQFMQPAAEWRLGGFDLRELGCIGVIFLDNPDLSETNSIMDDLAQADRYITMEISDQDTAPDVKLYLANKYSDIDLTDAFAARDSLPSELRYIVSWRTFDQMIEVMLAGNPGHFALPYVNGGTAFLTLTDKDGNTVDRTKEFISKLATALDVPYIEKVADPVSKGIRDAIANGWSIRIIGPHGVGKTELTKAEVKAANMDLVSWSAPVTDPDTLICPVPNKRGSLDMIPAQRLAAPGGKVIFIDEASRPKDLLSYARTNELIHEHSLGGIQITDLSAVIAAENPPEFLGRKYDVSEGNIAHADRYELTIVMNADDVPFYDWLMNTLPGKLAEESPRLYAHRLDSVKSVAEAVCEWHKNDIDNDGRAWITPRNLQRMIVGYLNDVPLENTKIWLGPGERAPVPLHTLEARLSGQVVTGLREIVTEVDTWVSKLESASEDDNVGMKDVDTVHTAFLNAETDSLWESAEHVAALVKHMPARFRVSYFNVEDGDRQKFWMKALATATGRMTRADLVKEREKRSASKA